MKKEKNNTKELELFKLKVLLDYTNYIKECVSSMGEINKNTVKDYLDEDHFYKKQV